MGLPDYAEVHVNGVWPPAALQPARREEARPGDDPGGGKKLDAGKVRMTLITGGMARALYKVAEVATFGAIKYSPGGWVHVPDGFNRYADAQQRHAAYFNMGEVNDTDSNLLHLAHEAWNALAKLDLYLREQEQIKK